MNKVLILLLLPFLFFLSCKRCQTEACNFFETITLHLIHYSEAETDTIIIRRYKTNTNFSILIDSVQQKNYVYSGDTMNLFSVDMHADFFDKGLLEYDLEIVNPSDNKTVRIFDISREHNTHKVCSGGLFGEGKAEMCTNRLNSYNYAVNFGAIDVKGNDIYVSK
jgi:hypothetical protein